MNGHAPEGNVKTSAGESGDLLEHRWPDDLSSGGVISRRVWKAADPRVRTEMKGPARTVIVHHTALWSCVQPRDSLAQLAHIQNLHMHEREFDDIGYNFLISGDGSVYEGRGWGVVGAHAKDHNLDSVGIAFMGNFNDELPTPASLTALQRLLRAGEISGHVQPDFVLVGHRDVAKTECPGENVYSALTKLRTQLGKR
ncbi:peptidoglycan recognition protein 5 [Misgurnus anguillicaudatus]|uniref:peptidoglycan recognition protein 5 n=1 Tax=Misgurnus anguillicaudatus TaxID=75329 RepID=UPI0024347E66|nr:peptidoglycan recognition protein 5 [Misgurnus anguillicaudatus]